MLKKSKWGFAFLIKDQNCKEDYETCSGCGKKFKMIVGDVCYDCTFGDPLFWCYKHEHYSFDRVKCSQCLKEIKLENQKGSVLL